MSAVSTALSASTRKRKLVALSSLSFSLDTTSIMRASSSGTPSSCSITWLGLLPAVTLMVHCRMACCSGEGSLRICSSATSLGSSPASRTVSR